VLHSLRLFENTIPRSLHYCLVNTSHSRAFGVSLRRPMTLLCCCLLQAAGSTAGLLVQAPQAPGKQAQKRSTCHKVLRCTVPLCSASRDWHACHAAFICCFVCLMLLFAPSVITTKPVIPVSTVHSILMQHQYSRRAVVTCSMRCHVVLQELQQVVGLRRKEGMRVERLLMTTWREA
jgi:hypothetical protein